MRVYNVHGDFPLKKYPPTSGQRAIIQPRLKLQALPPRIARTSWYMRHIWPYLGIFAPLRMAVRRRLRHIERQERAWEAQEWRGD